MPDWNLLAFKNNVFLDNVLNRTNNYMKLIKILSFIYRFLRNTRKPKCRVMGELSVDERREAELKVI